MSLARRLRPFALGLGLTPFCAFWAQDQPVDRLFSLMVPPVALVILLACLNRLVAIRRPCWALAPGEIVVVYVMLSVACAVCGEWMDMIVPQVYGYAIYADTNPRYTDRILPHLSDLLFFRDGALLKDFREGGKPFAVFADALPIWLPKVGMWTVFLSLLVASMGAVNHLFREQWIAVEKLSFPLVQIPLALADPGGSGSVWRSRLLWTGFSLTFGIDLLNGVSFLYPSIPNINVRYLGDVNTWFAQPPWNQTGWTPIGLFPYISALGAFVPTDLLFSVLFFFVVRKAQQILAFVLGNEQGVFGGGGLVPSPPYFSEQSWGAFLGLFVTSIWLAKPHWRRVRSLLVAGDGPDRAAGRSYRTALGILATSIAGLGTFGALVGIPFPLVVVYVGLYLAFSVAVTRLRAQLGAPTHEMAFMGPHQLLLDWHGSAGIDPGLATRVMTTFHLMNRIHRTHAMPMLMEGRYLADRVGVPSLATGWALAAAVVLGSVAGQISHVALGYRWTPVSWVSSEAAGVISQLQSSPRPPNPAALWAVGGGAAVVWILDFVRFRIPGFWLHPAGYALAMNFGVDYYWFGLTLVLIAKVFLQRYWGLRGTAWMREAAIGVVVGEFAAEFIWAMYAMLNDRPMTYTISINGKMAWNL